MLKKQLNSLVINTFKKYISRSSTNPDYLNDKKESEVEVNQQQQELSEDTHTNNKSVTQVYKQSGVGQNVDYFEKKSKHRPLLTIYDLKPTFCTSFIAPNATLVGEVFVSSYNFIGFNTVIRGDINSVRLAGYSSIGDHVVINTVNSLPTGLPSVVDIGEHVTIQSRCSLTSCIIEDQAFIGHNSVILEGARIESGAVVLPNSVVPPGRIIPSNQVWGGNPVRYVRDLKPGEVFSNYANTFEVWGIAVDYRRQYDLFSYSYLDQDLYQEDVDLTPESVERLIGQEESLYTINHIDSDKNYLV